MAVDHGVSEGIGRGFAVRQRIKAGCGIAEGLRGFVEGDGADRAGGVHGADFFGVAIIDIGIVAENQCCNITGARSTVKVDRIIDGDRRIVGAGNGNGDAGVIYFAMFVCDRVGEDIYGCLTFCKRFDLSRIGAVDDALGVLVKRYGAIGQAERIYVGDSDGIARIRIGIIAEHQRS